MLLWVEIFQFFGGGASQPYSPVGLPYKRLRKKKIFFPSIHDLCRILLLYIRVKVAQRSNAFDSRGTLFSRSAPTPRTRSNSG